MQFNRRPYLRHHDSNEKENENAVAEAMKLKATTVSLADGTRSEVLLNPSSVSCSNKGYRGDEYHVAVAFDLAEFEHTATEKLMHAQLVVMTSLLVDYNNHAFETADALSKRGLPIYVFEQNDE